MSSAPSAHPNTEPPLDVVVNLGTPTWFVSVVMTGHGPTGTAIKNVISHIPAQNEREAQGTAVMHALAINQGMQIALVTTARVTAVPAER